MKRTKKNTGYYLLKIIAFILTVTIFISILPVYQVKAQSVRGNFNRAYLLSGNQADKLVTVANAQAGRTEKQMGYNVAWCAYFVSDCALLAGIGNLIPYNANCNSLYNAVKRAGGREVITPQKGDLIFYRCSTHGFVHTGIMLDAQTSIEGNTSNKVRKGKLYKSSCYRCKKATTRKFLRPAYQNQVKPVTVNKVALHSWISETGMGKPASQYKNGQTYYLCYELTDAATGKRLDSVAKKNYTITETIYKPNGSVAATTKYNNDNNWIRWTSTDGGTYRGEVTISGDYNGTSRTSYVVPESPRIQLSVWISDTKMGQKTTTFLKGKEYYLCYKMIDLKTNKALNEVSTKGYKIQESVYAPDGSLVKTGTHSYSDKNCISFVAEKTGTYTGVVKFAEGYSGEIRKNIAVTEPKKPMTVSIHAWLSETGMGNAVSQYKNGQTYYLCYELIDSATGRRIDSVEKKNYTVTETIYKPNGSVACTTQYNNDNNWIRHLAFDGGTYKGTISISGDFRGTATVAYTVPQKPKAQLSIWFSETKMGEKATAFEKGKQYYLCYKLVDLNTNKYLNQISGKSYKVQESVYYPDGTLINSATYSNSDSNCIPCFVNKNGTYKGVIKITGGFKGQITKNIIAAGSNQQKMTVECMQINENSEDSANNGNDENNEESPNDGNSENNESSDSNENSESAGSSENNESSENGVNDGNSENNENSEDSANNGAVINTPEKLTGIKLFASSNKLAAGKKVKLTAKVTPANAANKSLKWSTSNKKYATVDQKGNVTLKKAGAGKKVVITAMAKDGSKKKATYKITIMKHGVKSIKIKASAKTIKAGKSLQLKTTVKTTGKKVNKKLKWTSSNSKYAKVNSKGKVTAKKAGKGKTVTITVKSTDGSNKKATIKLKIK